MNESALLTGILEPTNEPYAIAKIAGIKVCESYNRQYGRDYRSVMPTNLYGINDNFHPKNSHVIPALMRRFHEAKESGAPEVIVWGIKTPMREFLYVDDMAAASVHVMELDEAIYQQNTQPMLSHINVGTGVDLPYVKWLKQWPLWWVIKVKLFLMLLNLMALRVNLWTLPGSKTWAGNIDIIYMKAYH